MSRLFSTGAESGTALSEGVTAINTGGTSPALTVVATPVRTGGYAFKSNQGTTAGGWAYVTRNATLTSGLRYFYRAYVYFSTAESWPSTTSSIVGMWDGAAGFNNVDVLVSTAGVLSAKANNASVGTTTQLLLDTWHRVEFAVEIVAGTNTDFLEIRVDGASIYSSATAETGSTVGNTGQFSAGYNVAGANDVMFLDDLALNDENGTLHNSWAGDDRLLTPTFICGAECGINAIGTTHPGVEHWSAVSNAPSVVTSGPASMRSTRAYRFNPGATTIQLAHTFATAVAAPSTVVGRLYVYFTTLPNAEYPIVFENASGRGVYYKSNKLWGATGIGGTYAADGITVTTGQWYRVDFKIVRNVTATVDLMVDGTAAPQLSVASSSATSTGVSFGSSSQAVSGDWYIDDICISGTASDYPINAGAVVGLYPNGDLTNSAANPTDGNSGHFYSATTDFGKGSGGATATGAQNVEATSWQSLSKPLFSTVQTNFLSNLLGVSTEHLVHTYEDLPAGSVASVNGLAWVSTHHAASTTANTQRLLVRRGTTADFYPIANASTFTNLAQTTIQIVYRCKAVDSTGVPWTETTVNSLQTVWDSDDVNPDAYLDGSMAEIDIVAIEIVIRPTIIVPVGAVQRAASW